MTASRRVATHVLLLAAAVVSLTPFVWLCCAAFKRPEDIFASAFVSPGQPLTLENVRAVLTTQPFVRWMTNSIFLASTHTLLVVTLGSVVLGLALARPTLAVLARIRDVATAVVVQFCTTFGVWMLAERLHLSGIITMVVYAMAASRHWGVPAPCVSTWTIQAWGVRGAVRSMTLRLRCRTC